MMVKKQIEVYSPFERVREEEEEEKKRKRDL